jgi:putative transposase
MSRGHADWLYHVFSLSLRHVELLLAEPGVVVSYETVRRWCKKFGASFADRLGRRRRRRPGDNRPGAMPTPRSNS